MAENNLSCPECKSAKLIRFGKVFRTMSSGKRDKVQQYRCTDCGKITTKPIVMPPRDSKGKFIKKSETAQNVSPSPQEGK